MAWVMLSVVLFLAMELGIGAWLAPLIAGKYVSPMFHFQVQLLMHLAALYLGGLVVGLLSPGRRLLEPAVGAALSVALTFAFSLFMPTRFYAFDLSRLVLASGIGFACALLGAWHGESLMGNMDADDAAAKQSAKGRFRASLWATDGGLLTRHRTRR